MKREEINWQEVQHLLDRFYEGATTRQEEEQLMESMKREDLPEALQTDAEVFRALAQESQQLEAEETDVPQGFEERLMASIEQQEAKERLTLKPAPHAKPFSIARRYWTAAAACLLLIAFASPYLFRDNAAEDAFAASDITQEEAEMYTAYALSMVSNTMKSGMSELNVMGETQVQIQSILNDAISIDL